MLLWPWARLEWRAVCAEWRAYGSGRRSAGALLTPLRTCEGFAYLAVIIDLYSRRVIGWAVQSRQTTDVVLPADGFEFANAKDPCGNSISISSRARRAPNR